MPFIKGIKLQDIMGKSYRGIDIRVNKQNDNTFEVKKESDFSLTFTMSVTYFSPLSKSDRL